MKKEIREKVWKKYNKCCAYCGSELDYKQLQVDHIQAYWHNDSNKIKGKHEMKNFNPSCARCNRWKGALTIESFRNEIQKQLIRLKRDSSNYRMALDYNMIIEDNKPIEFYFERFPKLKI